MTLALRLQTEIRSLARRIGVLPMVSRAWSWLAPGGERYEAQLRSMMQAIVRPGDTVWDIGANVGFYTEMFADWVGAEGRVCAFEPAAACFAALSRRVASRRNVSLFSFALGAEDGSVPFGVAADPLATSHSFAQAPESADRVRVARGDTLVATGETATPNVLKIDVEGFEGEVLTGAADLLRSGILRAVFVEMHFDILEKRGQRQAPARIVDALKTAGFATRWAGASQLVATR